MRDRRKGRGNRIIGGEVSEQKRPLLLIISIYGGMLLVIIGWRSEGGRKGVLICSTRKREERTK